VAYRRHVDEVDDNQAAEVTQTQLAGNLIGRFQVRVECRFFDVTAAGGASGVDIDSG